MIIAVAGHRASGKDTTARILGELGFEHVGFSEAIAEVAIERGWLDPAQRGDKRALGDAAMRIRAELGPEAYLERMVRDGVVLSGMRDPKELEALRSSGHDVLVIGIIAPDELRAERAISLGIVSSLEDLYALEQQPADRLIDEVLARADVVVSNDGTVDDLRARLGRVVEAARSGAL